MLLDSDQLKPPHLKPKKPKKGKKGKKGHKSDWNFFRLLPWIGSSPDTCSSQEFNPEEDPNLSVSSAESYLSSLREAFSQMVLGSGAGEGNQDRANKHLGGKWAERYVLTHVSPSVVPNYFPTLRVVEYNITDLVDAQGILKLEPESSFLQDAEDGKEELQVLRKKKDKMRKPDPPAKTAPPGPAYSMQPYTFIGYTQYFLNLTKYNDPQTSEFGGVGGELRKRDVGTEENDHAPKLQYEVEYDTQTDLVYKLKDLTVRSYVELARRIVDASPHRHKGFPGLQNGQDDEHDSDTEDSVQDDKGEEARKKKKKKKKKKHDKVRDKVWHEFVKRAFVGTVDGEELERFEAKRAECAPSESNDL
jgi:endopolyphosphatase